MGTMTANLVAHDFGYGREVRLGGLAGLAERAGRALERWGRAAGEPPTRQQLQQRIEIEREARAAIVARGDAHAGHCLMLP
jgi:hypothetical protein